MTERDFEILDRVAALVLVIDRDGRVLHHNRACQRLADFPPEALNGRFFWELLKGPEERKRVKALFTELPANPVPRMYEGFFTLGQDWFWVAWCIAPTTAPDGQIDDILATGLDLTEHQHAVERMRKSEAELNGIISIAADAIISIDEDQRICIYNEGAERIFGYSKQEAIGQPLELLIPERFHAAHRQHVMNFAAGPVTARRMTERPDVFGLRKDGVEFPAEASISKLANGGRRVLTVMLRDISDRKRAEEALRLSDERFRLALRHGRVIMTHQDRDLRYTWIHNPRPGFSPERLLGKTDEALMAPEESARLLAIKREVLATGRGAQTEARVEVEGEMRVFEVSIDPLYGLHGEIEGLTEVSVDVTRRKRVEQELQFLAEAGSILAASLDYRATLVELARLFVRSSWCDFCVIDLLEEGTPFRLTVEARDPADAELAEQLRHFALEPNRPYISRAVLQTGQSALLAEVPPGYLEQVAQRPENLRLLRALAPKSLMGVPLIARGRLVGSISCALSRQSRWFHAADLRFAEEVARRAALSVDNARLYWAAQNASRARDEVLGVVAHDLRNPLNSIVLAATKLKRRPPGVEDERRSVQPISTILAAARMMNRLIQDLLDVARLEARQLTLERTPYPSARLVEEAVDAARPLAQGQEVVVEVEEGLPLVLADRDRVSQVLSNLIGNAIKFTPPGGRITVLAREGLGEVQFSVRDTGMGIPEDQLPHVFDRFWRGNERDQRGAGLGLTICKGIVETHGGRIWVESEPGVGSTFTFTLPVAQPADDRPGTHV